MYRRGVLLDFGDYPSIYFDGLGDVQYVGHNAQIFPFQWRRVEGVFRPVICALLTRPIATMSPDIDKIIAHTLAMPPTGASMSPRDLTTH